MPTTSVTSTIISSLGGGSGIDMAALAESLATAQFAARIDRNTTRSDTVERQLSAAATLKSQVAQLVSAVGERVRSGDLSVQPQIANGGVAMVSRGAVNGSGTYALEVTALATAQIIKSPPLAAPTTVVGTGSLTLRFGSIAGGAFSEDPAHAAVPITVPAGSTLADVASAINAARSGVTAYVLNGDDGAHLMLKGPTGASNAFVLEASGDPDVAALGWTPGEPLRQLGTASSAALKVDGLAMVSLSNTIADLVPGLSLTLTGTNVGAPTTVRFSDPGSAVTTFMTDLTNALNEVVAELNKDVDPQTGELSRDTGARALRRALSGLAGSIVMPGAAAGQPATLADLGLATNRDGTFRLDAARLSASAKASPAGVSAMLTNGIFGVFAALDKLGRAVASPTDPGTLAGSLRRLSEQKTRLAAEKTDLAAAQDKLRSQMITRFAGTDARVGASRATLSFLKNQIDAWNAKSN